MSHILAMALQTTFTIQKVKHHFAFTIFKDSLTSAVSQD
jgi:hypothetical protein